MQIIMWIDLAITLAAAIVGVVRWSKATRGWKLVIIAAWLLLFGSVSKLLAFYRIIPNHWGVLVGGIPVIMVLYVCGSELFLLLGLWRSAKRR